MKITTQAILLVSTLASACAMAIFTPTEDWQRVPEGVAIPGGLEVRLDLENGGKWARLMGSNSDKDVPDAIDTEASLVTGPISFTSEELDKFEDEAHDYDDGVEIAQKYGASLLALFADRENANSDQAGHILNICARNNYDATRALISDCPNIVDSFKLDKRSLSIMSAFVSTKDGLAFLKAHGALARMQKQLAANNDAISDNVVKALSNLLSDLAIAEEDGEDWCRWTDAIQQAFYVTKNPALRDLALDIIEHHGEFENLKVQCRVQPGILPPHVEQKRAAETQAKLGNRLASRNHFDEL